MKRILVLICVCMLVFTSCNKEEKPIEVTPENLHQAIDQVVDIMIHDIFSPPVASRIFVYADIAAYEIIAQKDPNYNSLAGVVTDLKPIPTATNSEKVNYQVAALIAHMEVSKSLIFSEDRMQVFQDSLYTEWKNTNETEFNASKAYAMEVVDHIKSWMDKDNYKQTRTMPKFTVNSDDPSRWQPTPPAYMDGIEPHWMKIRPMAIDSAAQFKPIPPPEFSLEKDSKFFKETMEVYNVRNDMTEKGDASEEIAIAKFWDCNPYVSVTKGHLMFATKKITPGAHWIGIVKIACKKTDASFNETVFAYTKTAIAIFDGFISCWDEKYRSNLIRPETVINQYIDENWKPVLQTPPFPEYTSGHSVVSGAAAKTLTSIFGDNFAFDDDTEVPYGLPVRSFTSFNKAADEAAMSRMYGGIHYRAAIEVGVGQGRSMADFIIKKLDGMTNEKIVSNK
ncbi:vanadium-dependent haloperoxidase [Galbibacter sp. BG1]|uniref:vanadium-dependent haloperoxidase n=1 Tax=Galbibacter sp. BG1 TaxID=1170699 RepID=UPI0015C13095|nr:vanadium-dependent haloperoxidase [Galbibacter sp. BG1]QLE00834.1 vanadium-dependent haloperoxidase [Galbibacter sp. BG1]